METHILSLSNDEVMLLDGKCRSELQKEIDEIKHRHKIHVDPLIAEVIQKSLKTGEFSYKYVQIERCPVCKKSLGYYRYKKGRNEGQPDYKRRLYIQGIKFNVGFVRFVGHGDCCDECNNKHEYVKTIIDMIITQNLPITLLHDSRNKWTKDPLSICFKCKKEMYESEMGRLPTLMAQGTYAGKCPHCGAESHAFGPSHSSTGTFRMLPV